MTTYPGSPEKENNPAPRRLIIVGAGGLGSELAWVAEEMNAAGRNGSNHDSWELLGYADDAPEKRGNRLGGYLVHGTIQETAEGFAGQDVFFAVAVGMNQVREKLVRAAEAAGWTPATLVHPSVIVAKDARVGAGSYIAPGCVICPGAQLGNHVIVNTHVSVGHGSVVADFSQLCPGARVSGGCHVGAFALLGSNSSLLPCIVVGPGATVGANSSVVRDVAPGTSVVGCPARLFCQHR